MRFSVSVCAWSHTPSVVGNRRGALSEMATSLFVGQRLTLNTYSAVDRTINLICICFLKYSQLTSAGLRAYERTHTNNKNKTKRRKANKQGSK